MIFNLDRDIYFGLINLTVYQRGIWSLLQLHQNYETWEDLFFSWCILHMHFKTVTQVTSRRGGAILSSPILYALLFARKRCADWKGATVRVSLLPVQTNNGKGLWDTPQSWRPQSSPSINLLPSSLVLKHVVLCTNHPSGKLQNCKVGSLVRGQSNSSVDSPSFAFPASKRAARTFHFCMKGRRKCLQSSPKLMNYRKQPDRFRTTQSQELHYLLPFLLVQKPNITECASISPTFCAFPVSALGPKAVQFLLTAYSYTSVERWKVVCQKLELLLIMTFHKFPWLIKNFQGEFSCLQ